MGCGDSWCARGGGGEEGSRRGGEGGEVTSAGDFVSEVNVCVIVLYYM